STYGALLRQGDHIITLFSMQFLGRPVSPARFRCHRGRWQTRMARPGRSRPQQRNIACEARASPAAAKADPASIEPTRAERVGIAPAQDTRRKEWRTRNARPPYRWTRPGLRWRDVLRSVEEVAGVEPALDLAQPRIDRSRKGRAHACFA